jgi:hypothetical protein
MKKPIRICRAKIHLASRWFRCTDPQGHKMPHCHELGKGRYLYWFGKRA